MVAKNKRRVFIKDVINKYHIWDAREISELLPSREFIDVTVTSPPYWNIKDYGVESQIGFGQSYLQYLDDLEEVFRSIYAVTNKRGSLWIISDTIKHEGRIVLLPYDLAKRLEKAGWILQDIIIWNKDRTLPWSHQGKLRNIFEFISFFSKERKFNYHLDRVRQVTGLKEWWVRYPERYSPEGKAPSRAWDIPIPRQGSWGNNWVRHFNPLPPQLVERILLLTTDRRDIVLDPFSGSGTVLAQASVMGRRYLGLDLNKEYKEMFESRGLSAIRTLYEANQQQVKQTKKHRKVFKDLILSLRRTKYPKELVRLHRKEYGDIEVEAVLALQGADDEGLGITFLFPRPCDVPPDFLSQVARLCQKPPLSKYGIKPMLTASSIDVVTEEWLTHKGLDMNKLVYLYLKGRTYAWAQKMPARKWLEMIRNGQLSEFRNQKHPPVVSNIGVKVDPKSPVLSIKEG